MTNSSKYTFQFDSDSNNYSNDSASNTSCIELNNISNSVQPTIENVKRRIRIIQNFIESDLSELSSHISEYSNNNGYTNTNYSSSSYTPTDSPPPIQWTKFNELRTKIESNITKGTNILNSFKSNTSSEEVQILRYLDIFNLYQKDLNGIISKAESKQPKNMLLFDNNNLSTEPSQPTDRSVLSYKQNDMLKGSLYDIESLTEEALTTLHKSKESNERFVRIRNKMYSVLNTHLPNVDMVQKNIINIAVKNQLIIAVTIAICIFILLYALFR